MLQTDNIRHDMTLFLQFKECAHLHYYFPFSPVRVIHGHPYKLFVPGTVVNSYFCTQ